MNLLRRVKTERRKETPPPPPAPDQPEESEPPTEEEPISETEPKPTPKIKWRSKSLDETSFTEVMQTDKETKYNTIDTIHGYYKMKKKLKKQSESPPTIPDFLKRENQAEPLTMKSIRRKIREGLGIKKPSKVKQTSLDSSKPLPQITHTSSVQSDEKEEMSTPEMPRRSGTLQKYFSKDNRQESTKKLKTQIWSSVVTIVLVEGKNLLPMDPEGTSDPYVKFRLGNEKFRSKAAMKTLNPRWLEQFDFHMYDDQSSQLDIQVFDHDTRTKDDFMGRATMDLKKLEREVTHNLWIELEDGAGSVFLLLTISGTTSESVTDLASCPDNPRELANLRKRYSILRSFHNLRDVGHLTVKVFKAQGLVAADLGGKSDPFCVLELVNARLQTQTEYRTLEPSWQKIFTFNVKDVHSVLEVSVFDEDRDNKVDFLGRVAIPLLKVRDGEKKWYALKDKHLRGRAKGACPQILLEVTLIYNPIRACIRTLNPKEEKYMQSEPRFKRAVFTRNFQRIKAFTPTVIETGRFIQSCFEWESPLRSLVAFVVFLVTTYCFELYMLPLVLLLIFLKNYLVICLLGARQTDDEFEESEDEEDEEEREKDKKEEQEKASTEQNPPPKPAEEKKSLKERLQAVQDITATVQNILGYIAALLESTVNTFNFTVPFLSWLAIFLLALGTIFLYLIPLRYLIMAWGTNKFTKKLIRPNTIPNNELLDFLSRVPDNVTLSDTRELKLSIDTDRRREQRRKKTS